VLEQFRIRLRKNIASISKLQNKVIRAAPLAGDARTMPISDESIDMIITSPPYANAIDYMRAHKFSLIWFGEQIKKLAELRAKYIGSERINKSLSSSLPDMPERIIETLSIKDKDKAIVLRKYLYEMGLVLNEMYRVLKHNSAAIVVVGTSIMRGIDVETHICLAKIAETMGFEIVKITERILDRNKRMMPARFGPKTTLIEQRMHEEYVIGLLKP
jgi:DNA modification methylase